MPILLLALSTALAGLAGDAVIESIGDGGSDIVALGGTLHLDVGATATLTILTALSAIAALAWAASVAFVLGRGRERRLTAEIEARWAERAQHNGGVEGRNKLLEFRVAELQTQLEDIAGKRDEILEEMATVRARARELALVAREQQATIASLSGEPTGEEQAGGVVRLPDPADEVVSVEEATAEPAAESSSERHGGGANEELHRLGF